MIHIEHLTKQFPTKTLFADASAHLRPNTRVGLVGRNGTGKTSLLRMIIGNTEPDSGAIRKRPWLRIGYLAQEIDFLPGQTLLEAAHRHIYPEHEAKRILTGLGFSEQDWDRSLDTFSGGYRMRVALGHLLLSNPDILMLDEPTNHLDKPTQAWLESFLLSSTMTMILISHDTKFLDRMATHIWEIRHEQIQEFRGNYRDYQRQREQQDQQLASAAARQSKEVARVQNFVDRFRYKANKAKQVQSRIKQLEKIKLIEQRRDAKRMRFKFPEPTPSGKQVLELRHISKRYGDLVVYESLDFSVERQQRVALVGENGAGKSTLLKILAGVLDADTGTRKEGHGVSIHYFAQHQAEILNPEHSILESLAEASPQSETNYLRGLAGIFLFSGEDQKKPIKALSGGERNRVALARMLAEPANTLLLDEPTNHLDPGSVDILTDAMVDFPGTIVFISHDPTFLSRVATRVVEIDNGQARDYYGDYEYYLWKRAQELDSIKETVETGPAKNGKKKSKTSKDPARPSPALTTPPPPANHRREMTKSLARLEKQVAKVEGEIGDWETRLKARDSELADPVTYQDYARWTQLHKEREEWGKELDLLTHRWTTLSTELESLKTQFEALQT